MDTTDTGLDLPGLLHSGWRCLCSGYHIVPTAGMDTIPVAVNHRTRTLHLGESATADFARLPYHLRDGFALAMPQPTPAATPAIGHDIDLLALLHSTWRCLAAGYAMTCTDGMEHIPAAAHLRTKTLHLNASVTADFGRFPYQFRAALALIDPVPVGLQRAVGEDLPARPWRSPLRLVTPDGGA
ncbi:hypothetical protein [Actinokineospora enzanensis]|uniref:hypothetical protein n=1 Tax=Actinokineospora enzanensis TaxID=155975 RepID=UPI0003A1BE73|nr:hypothetical protein [Actinokineospora enzanensis]